MTRIMFLRLSVQEAQLIEAALKGEGLDDQRWFLIQIGRILVSKKPMELGLPVQFLWWLRDRLDPFASVGGTTGFDVILKIYDLLLEAKSLDLQEELGLPPLAPDKEEQDSESRDEDTTKDGTKDGTEDTTEASRTDGTENRPDTETEPRETLPGAEG